MINYARKQLNYTLKLFATIKSCKKSINTKLADVLFLILFLLVIHQLKVFKAIISKTL